MRRTAKRAAVSLCTMETAAALLAFMRTMPVMSAARWQILIITSNAGIF